jgi:hypothetical protein
MGTINLTAAGVKQPSRINAKQQKVITALDQ